MPAGTARLQLMQELRAQGASLEEIGRRVGLSRQRVARILGPTGRVSRRYRMSTLSARNPLTAPARAA